MLKLSWVNGAQNEYATRSKSIFPHLQNPNSFTHYSLSSNTSPSAFTLALGTTLALSQVLFPSIFLSFIFLLIPFVSSISSFNVQSLRYGVYFSLFFHHFSNQLLNLLCYCSDLIFERNGFFRKRYGSGEHLSLLLLSLLIFDAVFFFFFLSCEMISELVDLFSSGCSRSYGLTSRLMKKMNL